jgi:hypothetical protein
MQTPVGIKLDPVLLMLTLGSRKKGRFDYCVLEILFEAAN